MKKIVAQLSDSYCASIELPDEARFRSHGTFSTGGRTMPETATVYGMGSVAALSEDTSEIQSIRLPDTWLLLRRVFTAQSHFNVSFIAFK
jgi:hypothetical protein